MRFNVVCNEVRKFDTLYNYYKPTSNTVALYSSNNTLADLDFYLMHTWAHSNLTPYPKLLLLKLRNSVVEY